MKKRTFFLGFAILLALSTVAQANVILDITNQLLVTDPTQLGRLSRSGVPSDWSTNKPFPGTVNPTTAYHYQTFAFDNQAALQGGPFIQINVDDPSIAIFVSAYLDAHTPGLGLGTNYLGDDGSSGDPFGTNTGFFQVVVPTGHSLILVVNDVNANNGGLGQPFGLFVESFSDTEFSDPTPEPATMVLSGAGLALAVLAGLRRKANSRV